MSKLLAFGAAVAVTFGTLLPVAVSADTVDCQVTPSDISCSRGGGIPTLITMPWGLTGGETPIIAPGVSVTDPWGRILTCPQWFPPAGCYDITKTAYYRTTVLGTR